MKECNVFIISVIGNAREKNEDNFYFDGKYRNINTIQESVISEKISLNEYHIFAVFDGMGGEHNGELASYLSAKVLDDYARKIISLTEKQIDLNEAIYELNNAVCKISKDNKSIMGSTAVILELKNQQINVCNVGDSRAYVYRNDDLIQLTEDHTVEADNLRMSKALGIDLVDLGTRASNTLTQHLGIETDEFVLEPAISNALDVKENDIYLICSDGLSHFINKEEICKVLKQKISITEKGKNLKDMALAAGGNDNITVILLDVI